ncbi:MAG: 16S rRNA (guanine(527)-N(7))-methyltransferase RsmG [Capsulimonadales bacterium]|nr:16S rRNA (guanine(527)-N(7))-methyltransferase RsmG [Capsulimonadales bacterium]
MTEEDQVRFRQALIAALPAVGVPLDEEQMTLCERFARHLLAVNERMNLTRITGPEEMAIKHFADSLTVLSAVSVPAGSQVIDVGTGAGFPGMVLKIVRPDIRLTLLDSLSKRLRFLDETISLLGLTGVDTVHLRAEDAGRDRRFRDRFDLVTARAVAALPMLLEWCGPLVRPGGSLLAMKGANAREETAAAGGLPERMNLRPVVEVRKILPATDPSLEPSERFLLVYRKSAPTPARFPRRPADVARESNRAKGGENRPVDV